MDQLLPSRSLNAETGMLVEVACAGSLSMRSSVCGCVCLSLCMRACVYVYTCVYVRVRVSAYGVGVWVGECMCICMCVCVCVGVCLCVNMCVCVCVCVDVWAFYDFSCSCVQLRAWVGLHALILVGSFMRVTFFSSCYWCISVFFGLVCVCVLLCVNLSVIIGMFTLLHWSMALNQPALAGACGEPRVRAGAGELLPRP
jgi:hypothetical protein